MTLPFIAGLVGVSQNLPDVAKWEVAPLVGKIPVKANEWITVGPVLGEISVGGENAVNSPLTEPVIQITAWAKPLGRTSTKPRLYAAANLAERIKLATLGGRSFVQGLIMPITAYDTVELGSVTVQRNPRRRESDIAALSKYTLDLSFMYTPTHASALIA